MDQEIIIKRLMDFLASESYTEKPENLQAFLQEHPECREAWEEIRFGWNRLENIEPVPEMPDLYEDLPVEADPKTQEIPSFRLRLPSWSIAAVWVVLGLAIGLLWPRTNQNQELKLLTEELRKTRLSMQVLMLQSPEASQRMQAVNLTEQTPLTEDTGWALTQALKNDPSLNVRLAALDVLSREADKSEQRSRIIACMPYQDAPLLRASMADLAREWQAREAIPYIQNWLTEMNMPPLLREKLESILIELQVNV